jgi:hypothetical protein
VAGSVCGSRLKSGTNTSVLYHLTIFSYGKYSQCTNLLVCTVRLARLLNM